MTSFTSKLKSTNSNKYFNKQLSKLAIRKPVEAARIAKIKPRTSSPKISGRETFKLPPVSELQKKYKAFVDHEELYETAYKAFTYFGHILTFSQENVDTGAISYGANSFSDFNFWKQKKQNTIGQRGNDTFNYMKVTSKYIETRIRMHDFSVGIGYQNDPLHKNMQERFVRLLKTYFPDFNLPTNYEMVEDPDYKTIRVARVKGQDCEMFLSLEKFAATRPKYEHKGSSWGADDYLKLPGNWASNNFGGIAYIESKLKVSEAKLRNTYNLELTNPNGTLYGSRENELQIPVTTDLVFRWPVEFAYYVTCCTRPAEFIPFMFFQYVSWHRFYYGSATTRGGGRAGVKPPSRINHLGNIVDMMEQEKKAGRNPKPRTNEDNFTILGAAAKSHSGEVLWVPPDENRVPEYLSLIKGLYNAENSQIEIKGSPLKGVNLLTDWVNDKFSYMLQGGVTTTSSNIAGIATIDLTASIPLEAVTIKKYLDKLVEDQMAEGGEALLAFFTSVVAKYVSGEWGVQPSKHYFTPEYLAAMPDMERFSRLSYVTPSDLMNVLAMARAYSPTIATIGGGDPITPTDDENPAEVKSVNMLNNICKIFREVAEEMLRDFDKIGLDIGSKLIPLRFILFLITKYGAGDYPRIVQQAKQISDKNKLPSLDILEKPDNIKLPNLAGLKKEYNSELMPHQIETFNALQYGLPKTALLDISMGGGKSLLSIGDALHLINEKKVKRALFIMPGNLVKNTINEIQKFSAGEVNPFALTLQTIRRMNVAVNPNADDNDPPNYDMLKKLIELAPPNTLFISNYRFLITDAEDIVYGNKQITRYRMAEFLREMGFDACFVDESHFAKNLDSMQTQATAIVFSAAEYQRELSGTMVSNTMTDLVGQLSIANPASVGTADKFNSKYGAQVSGKSVTVWQRDAAKRINEDLRPYAMRMTHKRQRWAFKLPKMHEQFHDVYMTDNQKKFYDQLLQEAIDEIQVNNPKLAAKMRAGDEEDAKAIEQGLATYFQAVEAFVYAPDSNEAFNNLETTTPEDKVSPKVAKVVEILKEHYYKDGSFNPKQHKVIIFSHRRPTSEHMERYLPRFLPDELKGSIIRYTAGNQKALDLFNDPKSRYRVLVADEKSINTGQNLQIASRMIRLETLWSPGDQDQAIARIWRPAFGIGSDRTEVFMDWIFTNYSLEVTKIGRLVSKIVDKIKYDRQEDPKFAKDKFNFAHHAPNRLAPAQIANIKRFLPGVNDNLPIHDMLESLPVIKMNTDNMTRYNNASSLAEYFATYTLVNMWEDILFDEEKASGKQQMYKVPDEAYVKIAGSKKLNFIPRVPGVDPRVFDPENKFGYKPISIVESEVEDEDEAALRKGQICDTEYGPGIIEKVTKDEYWVNVKSQPNLVRVEKPHTVYIQNVAIKMKEGRKGENPDLVDCEFGYGYVVKALQNDVWVEIKGLGKVKVPKAATWVITNPRAKAEIEAKLKAAGKAGLPRLPGSLFDGKAAIKIKEPTKEPVTDEPVRSPKAPLILKPSSKKPIDKDKEDRRIKTEAPRDSKKPPKSSQSRKYNSQDVDTTDNDSELAIFGEIIDGYPALTCFAEDTDSDLIVDEFEFQSLPPYMAVRVINGPMFDKVLDVITKNFKVRNEYLNALKVYRPYVAKKQLSLIRPKAGEFKNVNRFINVGQHVKLKEGALRPFPLVWGDKFFICFVRKQTPSINKLKLKLQRTVPTAKIVTADTVHVKVFPGPIKAINTLKAMKKTKKLNIINYEETLKFLRARKGK